ncbi:MAG: septal ring lytic transglycosylase RlpA family protein [bacterium]
MKVIVIRLSLLIFGLWLMVSCGSNPTVSKGPKDGPPLNSVDVSKIPDAVPRHEPITIAGNKSPYTVFGKTYRVMSSSAGYRERGEGSWYGTKFHGRNTSNGERYDLFKMTAAHKTLPIPSYVKVTNLENGRSVIVRVNDRGPFHGGRIIDLSYAAAKKLGYADKGTARVEVEAIDPADYQRNTVEQPTVAKTDKEYRLPFNTFLQAGAFESRSSADDLADSLQRLTRHPVNVRRDRDRSTLYKVLLGPLKTDAELRALRQLLLQSANINAFVVYH